MDDLLLVSILIFVFKVGLNRPVVAYCAYIWIDMLMPHKLLYGGFASGIPFSMLAVLFFFMSVFINKASLTGTKSIGVPFLFCFFAFWITITTFNAMFPEIAWVKWDWAFKTIIASFLMMFVCKTRADIELILLTILSALSFFVIILGLKTFLGGVGYGRSLIPGQLNYGLYETSTLAAVSASMIPIVLYLKKNSILLPKLKNYPYMWYGFIVLIIAAIIGTSARTGLVSLAFLFGVAFLLTKKKFALLAVGTVLVGIFSLVVSDAWLDRMDTVNDPNEASAEGRVVVWRWTIDFAAENFLGGGFHAYRANKGMLDKYTESGNTFSNAKAFHSVYFEVLGEHGYIGFFCFMSILALSLLKLVKITRNKDGPEWASDASFAIFIALSTLLAGSNFVGIAFRPYIYYFVALAIALEKVYYAKNLQKS